MKVWKDANEVIKMVHDLDNHKLRQLDREMSKNLILINGIKRKKNLEKYSNIYFGGVQNGKFYK